MLMKIHLAQRRTGRHPAQSRSTFGRNGLDGFCMGGSLFGGPADGVRHDPCCAGECDADGVAGPDEMLVWTEEEFGNPVQDLEAENLGRDQARCEPGHDARKDGCCSKKEADGCDIEPEHLRGREPFRNPAQQAWHVENVADTERDRREAVETPEWRPRGGAQHLPGWE